jgi:hypothetical protein
LQKVGFVKVWAEEVAEDSKQTYEGQTQEQLAAILQDGAQLAGEPEVDEMGGLTFTVVDESKRMAFKVACVAPHEMRVGRNAKWGDDPDAIGEVCQRPRYELEEMGYDLEGIGADNSRSNSEADAMLGDGMGGIEVELHESHKLYEYGELYFKLDVDGDGVAEWVQVCTINGTLVNHEQVDDHPYADICLMPRAHAFFGDCPADRAFVIQKEQTNLSRALFDNVQFSTNQRTYLNTRANVNIGDLLDNRPGGVVRGEGPPNEAFAPLPTMPINQSAWQLQEWLNVRLENRTGFTRYSQGMDADSLNKTATGINIITNKADMRLRLMTRFAAQGVRKMFTKLLKLAVKHQDQQDWIGVNGQWSPVSPTEWRDQFNISINVGLGHGTKEQQAQAIMAMMPLQQLGLQVGVVRPDHIGHTIKTFAISQGFKNPDQFGDEHPQGPPAGQLQQQMQQLQQENQQLQQKAASKDADMLKQQIAGHGAQLSERQAAHKERLEWYDAETRRMAVIQKNEAAAAALDQQVAIELMGHLGDDVQRDHEIGMQGQQQAHDAATMQADQQHAAYTQAADQQHQAGMQDQQFTQQAAMDAAQATDGSAAPSNEGQP